MIEYHMISNKYLNSPNETAAWVAVALFDLCAYIYTRTTQGKSLKEFNANKLQSMSLSALDFLWRQFNYNRMMVVFLLQMILQKLVILKIKETSKLKIQKRFFKQRNQSWRKVASEKIVSLHVVIFEPYYNSWWGWN